MSAAPAPPDPHGPTTPPPATPPPTTGPGTGTGRTSGPAAGAARAARARLAYAWNNSPRPAWRTARRLYDSGPRRVPVTVSRVRTDQPDIAYLGLRQGEANILQLLEFQRSRAGAGPERRERGRTSLKDLAAGRWPDADLVVVGAQARQLERLPTAGSITAPFRVHLVVDVPDTVERLEQQISRRERWEFRRNQREHRWTLEEDSSPEAFDFFYRRMHLPTMRRRHGDRSRTESPSVARHAILGHGTLMFVTEAGTRVAGVLCHWSADRKALTTRLLGVLDAEERLYDDGAFKAVYHLLLRWACERRVAHVDFFGTEAFLGKGIFQWKRKFAPRVVLPPNHFADKRIRLYVRRDTPETRDFLVANPLLGLDSGTTGPVLVPTYFTDSTRPPRLDISARCPGLPEPRVVDLDDFLTGRAAGAGGVRP
ncbi:GNAT family N-acetyltransferase [Streptomyces sp. AM 4-1-1]|uniref:GNAT family N-acetyltransferase n=1 Tax=Streptomyces sp. AM 4-1-1 TaxID=3028710 RepID=UPI0023BA33E1|nr:GNAT family N-acetyltransferase [Streptomyces sp. AM 4-1-1]WEH34714.1 GNAT family N-acetyltransferase [Streptomyces sp. AM 4-1-1]